MRPNTSATRSSQDHLALNGSNECHERALGRPAVVVCTRSTTRMLGFPFLDLVLIDHRGLNEQHIARVGSYLTFDRVEIPQACAVASPQ
jgi:hypothetical protein